MTTTPPPASATTLYPRNEDELVEAVRATPRVIPIGTRTKPRLSEVDAVPISLRELSGITEYEPEEFTFTARAGTPVREIVAALAAKGQHLPFDPMFAAAGATIGGTLASGVSGPGRVRYGSLRDFVLGMRFVDGTGRAMRAGGKVVKNAAGFDLPKFFVGSLGRFGVFTEITFKVFPTPRAVRVLELPVSSHAAAAVLLRALQVGRWEPRTLEYDPAARVVHASFGGFDSAVDALAADILSRHPGRVLAPETAVAHADAARACAWAHADGPLWQVAIDQHVLAPLGTELDAIEGVRWRCLAADDVSMLSLPAHADPDPVDHVLREHGVAALALRGPGPLRPGETRAAAAVEARVKAVLDPVGRFPGLDD
ncbi:FAD-binding protein [Opitutales bacterium ASA1]|uniref:FAD-binding protein n=1 Tax=Congregicoccus parvus TaxID=3081749 RepID=UPI002B2C1C12|nr:FAD-binding protein [Opitutales bacterium ASA1]